ncbi:hypothetical protein JP72_24805 [Salmonella enterica subsp. enterica serovar Senftenberg]|nr:hypothetical protein [Salmonella enterica subsp. enterica serovar Senftenberg]EBF6812390.1 hypothetical protein [Salmonella enterica subsp. enterica serovar Meleagridis]
MHTASQALAIERQASAQPSLAERVSRPKTRAILGLMRLNFLSVVDNAAEQTMPAIQHRLLPLPCEPVHAPPDIRPWMAPCLVRTPSASIPGAVP